MDDDKKVILYIDDDPDYLDAVRAIVESGGYEMLQAESGEEGLRVFRDKQPDLVLVDLMMEEVDAGTQLVKELQALGADVPIYMLSSTGDDLAMTVDYGELGLSGVFQKPIDPNTLLTALRSKLG